MDHLPEEIIASIVSHLVDLGPSRALLARYATVSHRWQQRVEAVTFEHIMLTPSRVALPIAAQAMTADRVRRFVRFVQVDVMLPPYDEGARARRENDMERAQANEVFTDVVRGVFALLSSPSAAVRGIDGDGGHRPQILLSMRARCVSDSEDMEARRYRRAVGATSTEDIFEARHEGSYLDLRLVTGESAEVGAETLPELHVISQFHVEATPSPACRRFAPRALCLMASRMPGLENIHWELCDNERRDVALRKKLRADFANTLQTLPSTLKHFNLLYDRRLPSDHSFQMPSLLDEPDQENDKLSFALHKLSQRLTTFDLIASVGPEVLWPLKLEQEQQQDSGPPHWPNMRRYTIDPGAITPSGKWRFQRPPHDASDSDSDDSGDSYVSEYRAAVTVPGDEKEDLFREQLDPDEVGPLVLAAARAAGRMPVLRSMLLALDPPAGGGRLEVSYTTKRGRGAADGGGSHHQSGDFGTAKLLVESHPKFQLDGEVVHAWREAASRHVGVESGLEVTIKDIMDW